MACSYLNISIQKINGFCEELLSENNFEAVLVNFCCYEYGANVSETVQKISTGALLELCSLKQLELSSLKQLANFIATSMKKII